MACLLSSSGRPGRHAVGPVCRQSGQPSAVWREGRQQKPREWRRARQSGLRPHRQTQWELVCQRQPQHSPRQEQP
eukprot:14166862-Alexandrium_andersonii.AAC.1